MFDYDLCLAPDGPARILVEADLKPVQGHRFQPTGFPDLGAAVFEGRDGTCVLVESPQSMANRLEAVCWDDATDDLVGDLRGLSYVRVKDADGSYLTSSVTEAHRLNSPYILGDASFYEGLQAETAGFAKGPLDRRRLALTVLKYDANALVHGLFLAKKELAGGRLRLERIVSAFIEAEGARVAASGGVKKDEVDPTGDAKAGRGHVPFARDEYVADKITAYFNVDLAQLRGYALPDEAARLLLALSLFKVVAFLDAPKRLRTACDLEVEGPVRVTRPAGITLPSGGELRGQVRELIGTCAPLFAGPSGITTVTWQG